IEERLLMHELMFEDREGRLSPVEQRVPGTNQLFAHQCAHDLTVGFVGKRLDDGTVRPRIADPVAGWRLCWIDASRKKIFQPRIDAGAAERTLHQSVEAERRQMALVEDHRMTCRNRAAVVR